jgi:Cu-Zn family superoxide dismutase
VVRLISDSDGVRVIARFEGLEPNSVHGLHIHEYGDCSGPGFKAAGDHFNPAGAHHGSPDSSERHEGDLGNVTAGPDGVALYEKVIRGPATPRELAGRAIIVHQDPDDLKSQPAGNSGARIACGVIGISHR